MSRHRLRPRVPRALLLAALLGGCAAPPAAQQPQTDLAGCTVREVSREPLTTEDGKLVYIDPLVLEPNAAGDFLLAGEFNYVMRNEEGTWKRAHEVDDSLLAAVLPRAPDEPLRLVSAPIPTRLIGSVRANARPAGGWDVIIAEVQPREGEMKGDTIARLWHGVLSDDVHWVSMDMMEAPSEGRLLASLGSSLIRYGDTLAWALRTPIPRHPTDVTLFELHGGVWRHEVIPTVNAGYLDIAHSDSLGLLLAIVQPDLSLPRDGNSLFVWTRQPAWQPLKKVVPSSREGVHGPSLVAGRTGFIATWEAVTPGSTEGPEVHASAGTWRDLGGDVMVLDSAATTHGRIAPVIFPTGMHLWIVDHLIPTTGQRELRLVTSSEKAVIPLGSVPHDFPANYAAAVLNPSSLLIVGASYDAGERSIVNLLLQMEIVCDREEA